MLHHPVIRVEGVTKRFSDANHMLALEHITLDVAPGEFFVIVGPSGSGKSTLLRIMSRLDQRHEGTVSISTPHEKATIGFVFQQFALLPWLTVFENAELAIRQRVPGVRERTERVMAELGRLGLRKFATAYPRDLSGGMRQRVGLARALVTEPDILFLDEAFSELDTFTAETLRRELLDIWAEKRMTIVMVTHLIDEALELGDRIAILTARPGKIAHVITNTLPRPRNTRSAHFFSLADTLRKYLQPVVQHP